MLEALNNLLSNPVAIIGGIFFFGASIFVHELGHFLAARWRGLVVERFSIGFGPRLFGWRKNGVDYRISAIPFGGYVALPQLADMRGIEGETSHESDALPPISYTDKMIVAVAGAVFNVLFAFLVAVVLWGTGVPKIVETQTTMIGYVSETLKNELSEDVPGPAHEAGLHPGDVILAVDGRPVDDFEDIASSIMMGSRRDSEGRPLALLSIRRGDETLEKELTPVLMPGERIRYTGIYPATDLVVGGVLKGSPAELAGIRAGDQIVSINGKHFFSSIAFGQEIVGSEPGTVHQLQVKRGEELLELEVVPVVPQFEDERLARPMIGVAWSFGEMALVHMNPFRQIQESIEKTIMVLKALLTPGTDVGIRNMSGPVGIGYVLVKTLDRSLLELLFFVVLININLAIVNLLPIPVLDGGHMAIATIGKLWKPLPPKLIGNIQGVMMLILLGVAIYVTTFDVRRVGVNESSIVEERRAQEQARDPVFSPVEPVQDTPAE